MRLHDFTTLTFDVYGTLIDWETGLLAALRPWLDRNGVTIADDDLLALFGRLETRCEAETPGLPYPEILETVHRALARELGLPAEDAQARQFGASVGDWPAFADSAESLKYLGRHFKLVVLSNVDNASLEHSARRLDCAFDRRFTAQDIGSYKPSPTNFEYLLDHVGTEKDRILHVAQSLFHDHVPCAAMGIAGAWIDRRFGKPGGGATPLPDDMPAPAFTFRSLAELCEAHRAEAG